MVHHFVEIRYQESVIFLATDVHLGHPDFVEVRRQIFQRKDPFFVNLEYSNSLLEMAFDQREMPFVEPPPWNSIMVEKACGDLTSLSLCYEHDVLLDRPRCI